MSIEKDLSRIAVALEAIAAAQQDMLSHSLGTLTTQPSHEQHADPKPAAPVDVATPTPPYANVATPTTAPVAAPPADVKPQEPAATPAPPVDAAPAPAEIVTAEQLNALCQKRMGELGGPQPIMDLIAEFGVKGLSDLPAERLVEFKQKLEAL